MHRRALVTGSAGVLGFAMRLITADRRDREFVFGTRTDCDLRDAGACQRLFRRVAPDAVMHLAAVSGGVALSTRYPATLLRDNVLMTINVLEAARLCGAPKLVMALSSGMYSPNAPQPIKEESLHLGAAHESNYSYAYAKRLIEPAVRAYRAEYGLNVIGLVPNGMFGEGDDFGLESASMPAALMRRFHEGRHSNADLVVWGDGSPLRELTYARDMACAFLWALDHYEEPDILNVGTSAELSVREVAWLIADELGIDRRRIVFDHRKPSGVPRKQTDTSRFARLSGLTFTPFRIGLRNTLAWLRDNYDVAVQGGAPTAAERCAG